eukprot:CAMPEP_0174888580 /NCGR_PEP_ID=MMETSP0167-20121228/3854_1 /TAXON_ID=38298 /ORGANISM="Rhodella maculata, Strain CCMP736" /LENGTH=334 /DNA_ID=CAMNT_0016125615 /DNA_START=17 /DNA_END=1021 /DNA_ORIENTATION=+
MTSIVSIYTTFDSLHSAMLLGPSIVLFTHADPIATHMESVFLALATSPPPSTPPLSFLQIDAGKAPDVARRFAVTQAPTFVFAHPAPTDGSRLVVAARVVGADPGRLNEVAEGFAKTASLPKEEAVKRYIGGLVERAPVVVFMKGDREEPKCKFSRELVGIFAEEGIEFSGVDILADEGLRAEMKTYSNWPTYPQVYAKGKFAGGLDVMKELRENGELKEALGAVPIEERIKALLSSKDILLFMKGNKASPQCGFSRQMVELLGNKLIEYDTFDILEDEDIRAGLKKFSNWPTYPQLYVRGQFIGGLDICKELEEEDEFESTIKEHLEKPSAAA